MAKCQSLQGIHNQDSRRFPLAFGPFVQRSFFNCIIISFLWHNIYCSWLMIALCHQRKSDTFTNSAKCNKILSLMDVEIGGKSHRNKHITFLVLSLPFVMQCSLKCNLTEFLNFFFFAQEVDNVGLDAFRCLSLLLVPSPIMSSHLCPQCLL